MNPGSAERAITSSALVVVGVYGYRLLTEGSAPAPKGKKLAQLAGQGSPPGVGAFVTAWGFTFLVVSVLGNVSPGMGGAFAILIAVGDVLSNGKFVADDINGKLAGKKAASSGTTLTPVPTGAAPTASAGLAAAGNIASGALSGLSSPSAPNSVPGHLH